MHGKPAHRAILQGICSLGITIYFCLTVLGWELGHHIHSRFATFLAFPVLSSFEPHSCFPSRKPLFGFYELSQVYFALFCVMLSFNRFSTFAVEYTEAYRSKPVVVDLSSQQPLMILEKGTRGLNCNISALTRYIIVPRCV